MLKSDPHKDHGKNVPGGGSSRCKDYEGGTNSEGVRTCEKQRGEQGENGGPVGRWAEALEDVWMFSKRWKSAERFLSKGM